MPVPVIMPKFGMTQETGTVVRWLHHAGDIVQKGDPLLEVETDKTVMEVEAPADGTLAGICAQPGQVVPVATTIAHILGPSEELPAVRELAASLSAPQGKAEAPLRATGVARKRAAEAGIDIGKVSPQGPGGRVMSEDVERYLAVRPDTGSALRTTPAARRIAREKGLDLAGIIGSGPRGRIQARDIEAAAAKPAPAGEPMGEWEAIPLDGMRRRIAERMQQSYQTAPHIALTVEVDVGRLLALRDELNALAVASREPKISVTAILVKACAWALQRHRRVNASLHGDEIHLHNLANIGIAVALDDGLIVPVLRRAERLSISEIAAQLGEMTTRARQGRLLPDDVSEGTFTLSNLGMFGVKQFTAIINPPQAAILAVGRIAKQPTIIEGESGDEIAIRQLLNLTLSSDHRVLDGATAAAFLQDLVRVLENPGVLLY